MPHAALRHRDPKGQGHRTEKPVRLFDGGGLYLEVAPSGGKWWRLRYRFDGKEKRLSVGTYPDTSLKEARKRGEKARQLLAEGTDPSAQRKADRTARQVATMNTFEVLARAWLDHRADAWVERTRTIILASLQNDVFPTFGARPIADIQPADIRRLVQGIEARGTGETAGRVFQRLRSIFRFAIAHEVVATDPTYPLKPAEIFKPRKVAHRAALSERDVPTFLHRLAAYEGDPTTVAALTLLMLTAVRPGELRGARWDEIDVERALWRVPAARMKMKTEHTVPLSTQAFAALDALRPLTGRGALVLPSPFYPGKPLSDGTLNSALARMGYKGLATAHGFRTLFSTCANEAGWNRDHIEKQLAHEDRD
ncbi:MAG: integrase arm-type DNA-binding domain-containing protein, partial [Methylibium sp.]|nr:integrase arm-type DNA-binding domain-containing protein [Methylibium sp.]